MTLSKVEVMRVIFARTLLSTSLLLVQGLAVAQLLDNGTVAVAVLVAYYQVLQLLALEQHIQL
jgi:hypothetical protein